MTPTPPLSVIMSVHNCARYLDAAINSIRTQTFADFEFLIVDDGSTDGSSAILDAHAQADPRIRIIRQANAGLINSLNRLLSEARAPLVARMDGDDIALPERFQCQLDWMRDNPGHGAVGSWAVYIDAQGKRGKATPDAGVTHDRLIANMAWNAGLLHPTVIMERAIVLDVGGYRGAFRHCEDYDLWLRLSRETQLANVPLCLLEYRRHSDQISNIHLVEQVTNAAIAWEVYCEVLAGHADPSAGWTVIPDISELDRHFGRTGVAVAVRKTAAPLLLHSKIALRGAGLDVIIDYVRDGGDCAGLWRTVARLLVMAQTARAWRLARALLAG